MNNICIFCASSENVEQNLRKSVIEVGYKLAENCFNIITGGFALGLMKDVVDGHAKANNNAQRYGVVPRDIDKQYLLHPYIPKQNIIETKDIHGRLSKFLELGDAFLCLPGGFGTLHELMDVLVQSQIGKNVKPIYLYNPNNEWQYLLKLFELLSTKSLISEENRDLLITVDSTEMLLEVLRHKEKATN